MISHELTHRFSHYSLLIGLMGIAAGVYIFSMTTLVRVIVSIVIGAVYMGWGMYTHRGELKTTRLVLEYVAVGVLGAAILGILAVTL